MSKKLRDLTVKNIILLFFVCIFGHVLFVSLISGLLGLF